MLLQTYVTKQWINWVFAAAATIFFAAHNKVRRVVDVCLLTCTIWLVHGIVTIIKFMHTLLLALICCLLWLLSLFVVNASCDEICTVTLVFVRLSCWPIFRSYCRVCVGLFVAWWAYIFILY